VEGDPAFSFVRGPRHDHVVERTHRGLSDSRESDLPQGENQSNPRKDGKEQGEPTPDLIGLDDVKLKWSLLWKHPGLVIKAVIEAIFIGL